MLQHVCITKDISHYAFDVLKRCFLKHMSKNRNYQALVYFRVNQNMYHITNKDEIKSLTETAKPDKTKINSDYFKDAHESTNIFEKSYPLMKIIVLIIF